jgi:FkbM family methyltransferase
MMNLKPALIAASAVLSPIRLLCEAALRRYPFLVGFEAIPLSKPMRFLALCERHRVVKLRSGLQLLVYTKEHVGSVLMYMGDFDPRMTTLLKRVLGPGDHVVDIGANVGWFSITAASIVGERGSVHSFEPQPTVAAMMRASIALNGLRNVTLHECALSDHEGDMELHLLEGNQGAASLESTAAGRRTVITVPVKEAGGMLASLNLPRIRLMKIDVEGHEATVLEAARATLIANSPEVIVFESNGGGDLFQRPSIRLLLSLGYRLFGVAPSYPEVTTANVVYCNDYLAIHDGPSLRSTLQSLGVSLTS